jgi:diadenylate cyclase
MEPIITPLQEELILAACAMVAKKEFDHLLYVGDMPLPEDLVKARSVARKKLIQAVSSKVQCQVLNAMGIATISLPIYDLTRAERFKIALVGGLSQGVFKQGDVVLGLLGRRPTNYPDSLLIVTLGADGEDGADTGFGMVGSSRIPSSILESVIELALSIAVDGWEGRPLGTLMVVGDSSAVMEKSKQITLNPFQGYSESEKNILNPEVRNAIRNFAVLDGAFVIREDGVVLAAGRYVKFDESQEFKVPLGLGARHVAAAGISQDTDAVAIVVSETLGEVRIFQKGRCVMHLTPQLRHQRWSTSMDLPGALIASVTPAKLPPDPFPALEGAGKEPPESKDSKEREPREAKENKEKAKESKDPRGGTGPR